MTGDGLTHATRRLTTNRGRLAPEETYRLVQAFVDSQRLEAVPSDRETGPDRMASERPLLRRIHRDMLQIADDFRESL
jgi:hypothetical protein